MSGKRLKDALDRQIIAELARDPQVSNRNVAARLGVSESTISLRIEGLIRNRVIRPSVQQNLLNAGFEIFGWFEIQCAHTDIEPIAAEIARIDNVFSISRFFENPFLLVMVFAGDMAELKAIMSRCAAVEGVDALCADLSLGDACIKTGIAAL